MSVTGALILLEDRSRSSVRVSDQPVSTENVSALLYIKINIITLNMTSISLASQNWCSYTLSCDISFAMICV